MKHALDCSTGSGLLCCDCGAERYRVYHCSPMAEKTGETSMDNESGRVLRWHRITGWRLLGTAASMEHAKAKFSGHPVLELTR